MRKKHVVIICLILSFFVLATGCSVNKEEAKLDKYDESLEINNDLEKANDNDSEELEEANNETIVEIDLQEVRPNAAGQIMVVMFHNFVEEFTPTRFDNGEYTTTFNAFRELLPRLYDKGYRLISLTDFLNNNISTPPGTIPMIFTFDDGTPGQFNLVEKNGELVANPNSAVGIMEEFNKDHPDFGLHGTFYVNLGLGTFNGGGTVPERLQYLIDRGFEIGNHTLTHINLGQARSAQEVMKEVGGNQKALYDLIPDYKMNSLALPFGISSKDFREYVISGEYDGVKYENKALMEVGWRPSVPAISKSFNPLSIHRVRAPGINPVDADLDWWLERISREEQYVSDGNPNTITIPEKNKGLIDMEKLGNRELITY